ncbi:CLUMA_CG002100, isoform A [Clunio marinus]|uniref:CLUMA_CG002100, isoform A n=1 Tax=Clunio marinus TaxID=568069 RepID=A0A1J1HQ31_9DIPT|nr:CLUMA_CG002100, isoform A [Clunio marinus]
MKKVISTISASFTADALKLNDAHKQIRSRISVKASNIIGKLRERKRMRKVSIVNVSRSSPDYITSFSEP